MDWVSFDEIKQRVTLRMVINHYGIELRPVGPNTLRGKCPLPSHGSEKSKESFTATLNKGVGGAWACQSQSCVKSRGRIGGNVLDLVAAIESCSIRDAAIKLQTWFLVPAAGDHHAPAGKEPHAESSEGKEPNNRAELVSGKTDSVGESETNKPLVFTLQNIDHAHAYLNERGITEETAQKFGVGYFAGKGTMHNRLVVPIHNPEGELVAYAGRSLDGSEPRYKFPAGFHKSLELFNLNRVRGEYAGVLVEGFFDCMKVSHAGFASVALMGSTMSTAQQNLLAENFGQVVLMLDGDEAGRKATEEIHERLRQVVYQVTAVDLPDNAQPDQLSTSEIQNIFRLVML
jgi:DNA primase